MTCVASIVYFPSKPSNAPSRSAVSDRTTFWKGFRDLLKNRDFWLVSGAKWDKKLYRRHTGFPGGFREVQAKHLHEKKPVRPQLAQTCPLSLCVPSRHPDFWGFLAFILLF